MGHFTSMSTSDTGTKPHGIIYCALNRVNGKRYIGQTTKNLSFRRAKHIEQANAGKRLYRFQHAIRKHGVDVFEFTELRVATSARELNLLEEHYIRLYDTFNPEKGYNSAIPNQYVDYAKIATGNRGRTPHNKGKRTSPATKEKILKAGFKTRFQEGHECPEELKIKLKTVHLGQHRSPITEIPSVRIQCVETDVIYETVTAAARALGISHSNFGPYWKGKRKSVAGFQWRRL